MPLPNFLILGAAKAGTTSLATYLSQHPQVFMSAWKELRFFAYEGHPPAYVGPGDDESNRNTTIDLASYLVHFESVGSETAIGEASPVYLCSERAPARICHYIPSAKLIMILRHPVERAFSHYLHLRRDGREPLRDFEQALAAEDERVAKGWEWSWHYRRVGRYASQLERYFENFDRTQIRIYLYEDFVERPRELMRDIFEFLGVDSSFAPSMERRHNVFRIARSRAFSTLLAAIRQRTAWLSPRARYRLGGPIAIGGQPTLLEYLEWSTVKPHLSSQVWAATLESFRDDILQVQELIGRDLTHWLILRPEGR